MKFNPMAVLRTRTCPGPGSPTSTASHFSFSALPCSWIRMACGIAAPVGIKGEMQTASRARRGRIRTQFACPRTTPLDPRLHGGDFAAAKSLFGTALQLRQERCLEHALAHARDALGAHAIADLRLAPGKLPALVLVRILASHGGAQERDVVDDPEGL